MARIVGIDLGTTNSLIAYMDGKTPTIIADADGTVTFLHSESGLLTRSSARTDEHGWPDSVEPFAFRTCVGFACTCGPPRCLTPGQAWLQRTRRVHWSGSGDEDGVGAFPARRRGSSLDSVPSST